MGNTPSTLTQYDIEAVQEHCNHLFSQQEIVSLYERFCQLDRNAKGFISADELMSVPEFALNPISQRLFRMVDNLNFTGFVAFLSAFSAKASMQQKAEFIFKVYDSDGNGKVAFSDILEVLHDLTGSYMSDKQREVVLTQVLVEAGYSRDSQLLLDDFVKVLIFPSSDITSLLPKREQDIKKCYTCSCLVIGVTHFHVTRIIPFLIQKTKKITRQLKQQLSLVMEMEVEVNKPVCVAIVSCNGFSDGSLATVSMLCCPFVYEYLDHYQILSVVSRFLQVQA